MSAVDVLIKITENDILLKGINLSKYRFLQNVQSEVNMNFGLTSALFDKAMYLRSTAGLPFWDSLMLSTFHSEITSFDDDIFREALRHSENEFARFVLSLDLASFKKDLEESDDNLAVSSLVKYESSAKMHICMLDLSIPFSKANTLVVQKMLNKLKLHGYLLSSGKSYHFYGIDLMEESEYFEFLLKMILFSPIIDKNWIVHQLLRKQAFLRVTKKNGMIPELILEV